MLTRSVYGLMFSVILSLAGCGGGGDIKHGSGGGAGTGGGTGDGSGGGQFIKVMTEAQDLALKILDELDAGKDVPTLNATYEKQIAELNEKIEKLPPLPKEKQAEIMKQFGGKYRQIDERKAAAVLKGPVPKLPDFPDMNSDQLPENKNLR